MGNAPGKIHSKDTQAAKPPSTEADHPLSTEADHPLDLEIDGACLVEIISYLAKRLAPCGVSERCAYCRSDALPLVACTGPCGGVANYCENTKCQELHAPIHSALCQTPRDTPFKWQSLSLGSVRLADLR